MAPISAPACSASSATGVTRAYYAALNRHRASVARSCLTWRYLASLNRAIEPDWENVMSARIVKMTPRTVPARSLSPPMHPALYRVVQVFVKVVTRYRQIGGSQDGMNDRFIYPIKQRGNSPWRIDEIGSGP